MHSVSTTCWCRRVLLPPTALKCGLLFLSRGFVSLHILYVNPYIYICNAMLCVSVYNTVDLEHWRGKRGECSDAATVNVISFLSDVLIFSMFFRLSVWHFVITVIHVNSHSMHIIEGTNKIMGIKWLQKWKLMDFTCNCEFWRYQCSQTSSEASKNLTHKLNRPALNNKSWKLKMQVLCQD